MESKQRRVGWGCWVFWLVAVLVGARLAYFMAVATGLSWNVFSSPYPPMVGMQCGTISSGARGTSGNFDQAEQCLWTAYQTCHAATLVYRTTGLDFTFTRAVTFQQSGHHCAVTDTMQGVQGNGHTTQNTYQCTDLKQQASGLLVLGCGAEGDILTPKTPN